MQIGRQDEAKSHFSQFGERV